MIPYIIGTILVIIALLIVGLILRKRTYDAVDRLESWKMDIMHRNTAAELAKIKGLNLSGETQEKFESWKEQWEAIVTKELPDIEEWLFEAEDAADRYRFSTAKKVIHRIEETLNAIENKIARMLEELDDLLLSEETSRKEIESLKPLAHKVHQHLLKNGDQFGKAITRFLKEIERIEEQFVKYDQLVEQGNYIEAKHLVDQITLDLEVLNERANEYPEILDLCLNHLPAQLRDLTIGIQDMENDGYYLGHLGFKENIDQYHTRLNDAIKSLEKGSISEVEIVVTEMSDQIKDMYEQLEQEAIAKSYIDTQISRYQDKHDTLGASFSKTKEEVDMLKKSYYFDDHDMEKYLQMEKLITSSKNDLINMLEEINENKSSYIELRNKIETGFKRIEELQQNHSDFKKKIRSLRKEELEAKETLSQLNFRIKELNRKIKKSNLPGVPNFIWNILEEATHKNARVIKALDKQPLDMSEVKQALADSEITIDNAVNQVDMMLDQAYLTEQVIQYANRYRSRDPFLAAKLSEAERLFRSYEYELSLEHAAKAIEEIEPGALKVIEANQEALLS